MANQHSDKKTKWMSACINQNEEKNAEKYLMSLTVAIITQPLAPVLKLQPQMMSHSIPRHILKGNAELIA